MRCFKFDELKSADLIVDALYERDTTRNDVRSDPLGPLTLTGNQGGFRFRGTIEKPELVVLYTTMDDPIWPDSIDEENGIFVYFGDHKTPGYELHDRRAGRGGNEILRRTFELAHSGAKGREKVPPFLVFSRGAKGRDAVFRGLAVPGAAHLDTGTDLIAIWKTIKGQRFQNYRATFTILNLDRVSRAWISELQAGSNSGPSCPHIWADWIKTGKPKPLRAEKPTRVRTKDQQLGGTAQLHMIAHAIYEYFAVDPTLFETFAADVVRWMDQNVTSLEVTRPSLDGGRDGIGTYRIGMAQDCVTVDFAVQAKCYSPNAGLGVDIVSRLISRLRNRQFGVLVTTSFLARQAYEEIVEDQHPIIVCSGGDIAELMVTKFGLHTKVQVSAWLKLNYPSKKSELIAALPEPKNTIISTASN
jgi:hypothetical protein